MPTNKLYYADCNLKTFTATVTGCEKQENGWQITLDATAFYPEGGGQACDLGTLDGAAVLDVQERGDEILHLCDRPLALGQTVEGVIQWQRRFDLMQQHTGEHIVSGLLHEKFSCHNVGFHIGAEVMEIDFDCSPSWQELMEIEEKANAVVWADLEVECGFPSREELPGITLEAASPCPSQSDSWTLAQRQRYQDILDRCDVEALVQREYTRDCMLRRNRYMVERSDFVLAVYDGMERGGTMYTLNYAKSRGLETVVIPPTSESAM